MTLQAKKGHRVIQFNKGTTGGNIYPKSCHHTDALRIDYTFPNVSTLSEQKQCMDVIEQVESIIDTHYKLIEALRNLIKFCESDNTFRETSRGTKQLIQAKQALTKAGAL